MKAKRVVRLWAMLTAFLVIGGLLVAVHHEAICTQEGEQIAEVVGAQG